MKFARRFFLAVPLAGALALAIALPASAAGTPTTSPVTVNATVATSVTITGLSASINLNGAAGTPVTATGAESYTVNTNDAAGFTLTIVPGDTALRDGSSFAIPNNDLSVTETGQGGNANSHTGQSFNGSNSMLIDSTASQGAVPYVENWTLNIPSVPAATYTETFTYTAIGN